MTLLSVWNWSWCLKLGMGGEVVKILNSSITGAFALPPATFFFFSSPLSLAPEKQIRVFVWLILMQWGESLVILRWEGTYWKAKEKGVYPALDVLKFKGATRSSGHCNGLGSDLFGAHITHKWSQCTLGMPWGPLPFKGCCQKKDKSNKIAFEAKQCPNPWKSPLSPSH